MIFRSFKELSVFPHISILREVRVLLWFFGFFRSIFSFFCSVFRIFSLDFFFFCSVPELTELKSAKVDKSG